MQTLVNPKSNQFKLMALLGGASSVIGAFCLLAAAAAVIASLAGLQVWFLSWLFGLAYLGYGLALLIGGQLLCWLAAMWEAREEGNALLRRLAQD